MESPEVRAAAERITKIIAADAISHEAYLAAHREVYGEDNYGQEQCDKDTLVEAYLALRAGREDDGELRRTANRPATGRRI